MQSHQRKHGSAIVGKSSLAAAVASLAVAGLGFGGSAQAADFMNTTSGVWHDANIWDQATAPANVNDNVRIEGQGPDDGGAAWTVDLNADSWQYFVDNSMLSSGSTGEYRNRQLRIGQDNTAVLNIDIGDGNVYRVDFGSLYFVGSNSGSNGTLNLHSGDIRFGATQFHIAEKPGATGLVSISGGTDTRLIVGRESGGVSMSVGDGGDGTFQIDGGRFRSRAGVVVGSSGRFRVLGSDATEVEVGDEGSVDGNWTQKAGGVLEIGVDSGGVTQINVADKGGNNNFVTFEDGSLLDVDFLGTSPTADTWTVLELENAHIVDHGLAFDAGVDSGWSFNIDNSGANGLLTVTYVPEPASLGLVGLGAAAMLLRRRTASHG